MRSIRSLALAAFVAVGAALAAAPALAACTSTTLTVIDGAGAAQATAAQNCSAVIHPANAVEGVDGSNALHILKTDSSGNVQDTSTNLPATVDTGAGASSASTIRTEPTSSAATDGGFATASGQTTANTSLSSVATNTSSTATEIGATSTPAAGTVNAQLATLATNTSTTATNTGTAASEIGATSSPAAGSVNAQLASVAASTASTATNTSSAATNTGTTATEIGATSSPAAGSVNAQLATLAAAIATAANQTAVQANAGSGASKAEAVQGISGGVAIVTQALGSTSNNNSGTITAGGTFQTLLASNASRKGCLIQNPTTATEPLYVSVAIATGSATTAKSYSLAPGATFRCGNAQLVVTDNIAVDAATTGHAFVETDQ